MNSFKFLIGFIALCACGYIIIVIYEVSLSDDKRVVIDESEESAIHLMCIDGKRHIRIHEKSSLHIDSWKIVRVLNVDKKGITSDVQCSD